MEIKKTNGKTPKSIKISVEEDGQEVGRAFLLVINNDLHDEPFGFMEDVFVEESVRGNGLGTKLVQAIIDEAKAEKCYKLICTCRHEKLGVHKLYKKMGFNEHGLEFRMDFKK